MTAGTEERVKHIIRIHHLRLSLRLGLSFVEIHQKLKIWYDYIKNSFRKKSMICFNSEKYSAKES